MSYPAKTYQLLVNAYNQASKNAPAIVIAEMQELGVLIDQFKAFIGSGGFDEGDLQEIQAAQAESGIIHELGKAVDEKKIKKLFVVNGLATVHGLTLASFKVTNDEGDLLLSKISDQCGVIAAKALA